MSRPIRTYWWDEQPNFGDRMNPLLLQRIFGVRAVWSDLARAELVAAGSVIQWITPVEVRRSEVLHVWGSGYIFDEEPAPSSPLVRYAAVRGKRSAQLSGLDDDVPLGDPGLLASLVIDRPVRRNRVGFVPHLWHRHDDRLRALVVDSGGDFVDVTGDPADVIAQIAGCEFVFSSSLHGLVVADSYGIPNCWMTMAPALFGGSWKFDDYFSAFGITARAVAFHPGLDVRSVVDRCTASYERPGLAQLQHRLLQAFPFA